MRKNMIGLILILVCAAMCLTGCGKSEEKVSVLSVSEILGVGPLGVIDRFSGVVEAGKSVSVEKNQDMEIAELSVSEGDAVTKGQVLFSYDTSALSLDVERMQLEIEQLNNTITTKKSQITELEKEQKSADSTQKLQYTLEIQQLELDIKETEYTVTSKQKEIDRAKTTLADANVLSPATGHIKAINNGSDALDPNTGNPLPLIVIAEEGEFRVKGTINEMNAGSFSEGTAVVIRSRVDSSVVWKGSVESIDWENPVSNNNNYYYGSSDEMSTASKYPFYVKLESDDGLMIGQHVYIEQDVGQTESGNGTINFYLPSYYLSDIESEAWVWAANDKDKLEKRTVVLGNYNIEMDSYEILEGLELSDFIAYPDENCKAGAPVRYPGEEEPVEEGEYTEGEGFIEGEEGYIEGEGDFIDGGDYLDEGIVDEGNLANDDLDTDIGEAPEEEESEGGIKNFFKGLFGKKSDDETTDETTDTSTADPGIAAIEGTEAVG